MQFFIVASVKPVIEIWLYKSPVFMIQKCHDIDNIVYFSVREKFISPSEYHAQYIFTSGKATNENILAGVQE